MDMVMSWMMRMEKDAERARYFGIFTAQRQDNLHHKYETNHETAKRLCLARSELVPSLLLNK